MTPFDGATQTPADTALADARALVTRLVTIAFLALVVAAVVGLAFRYAEVGRDGRRNAENLTKVLTDYLAIRLVAIDSALSKVVASSRRIGGPAASEREWATALRTATSGVTGLSSIVITDAEGVVAYSTVLQIIGESWAERPIFKKLSEGHPNLLVADAPLSIGTGNEGLVPFGRALTDARGEFIGTAVATLVPDQLQDFYSAFDLGEAGVAWVLLPSGTVLFRVGSADDLADAAWAELPALSTSRATAVEGFIHAPLGPASPVYLTAYRRSGIANLVVAVSFAENELLSQWRYEAVAALILIVIAGVLLFFARRWIDRAMVHVIETARAEPEHLPDGR